MKLLAITGALLASCGLVSANYDNTQQDFRARNLQTIKTLYNLTLFPNQLPIIKSHGESLPKNFFNANISGRIDPVGRFVGFEDSVEYFFALAPIPMGPSSGSRPLAFTKAEVRAFVSECPDVAASVAVLYGTIYDPGAADHLQDVAPLKHVAFWKFDEVGAIKYYDGYIPNLNVWVTKTVGVPLTNPVIQEASIAKLCNDTMANCVGANQQWLTIADCIAGLTLKKYGDYDEASGDNVVCRSIHNILTSVRPDVHCPHVGPTGGGKCVDFDYEEEYFTSDQYLFNGPIGVPFMCGNEDQS